MWKKRALVMFALAWGMALFGLFVRTKFPDCGMASVKNTEMLDGQKVYFKSVDDKSEAKYYREHEEEPYSNIGIPFKVNVGSKHQGYRTPQESFIIIPYCMSVDNK